MNEFDVSKSGDVIGHSDMAAVIYITSVSIVIEDKLFECVFEEQQQKLFEITTCCTSQYYCKVI